MKYIDFCIPWDKINPPDQISVLSEDQALLHYIKDNLPEIKVEGNGGGNLYFGSNTKTKYYFDYETESYRGRQYIYEEVE